MQFAQHCVPPLQFTKNEINHCINGTKRRILISNLEIFEKFDHQTDGEWYQPYKKNAEARLSSESLRAKLETSLGAFFSKGQANGSIASGRNVSASSDEGPIRIREGVTLITRHKSKYWHYRNYIYKYSDYPFHMVGFIETIDHLSLWFQLLGDDPGEKHWSIPKVDFQTKSNKTAELCGFLHAAEEMDPGSSTQLYSAIVIFSYEYPPSSGGSGGSPFQRLRKEGSGEYARTERIIWFNLDKRVKTKNFTQKVTRQL